MIHRTVIYAYQFDAHIRAYTEWLVDQMEYTARDIRRYNIRGVGGG